MLLHPHVARLPSKQCDEAAPRNTDLDAIGHYLHAAVHGHEQRFDYRLCFGLQSIRHLTTALDQFAPSYGAVQFFTDDIKERCRVGEEFSEPSGHRAF